jgi:hypothetical protein
MLVLLPVHMLVSFLVLTQIFNVLLSSLGRIIDGCLGEFNSCNTDLHNGRFRSYYYEWFTNGVLRRGFYVGRVFGSRRPHEFLFIYDELQQNIPSEQQISSTV